MKKFKLTLLTILVGFLLLFLHNSWYYPVRRGYDAGIHQEYTRILIFEERIPTKKDTPESYNPPTFYFLSGKLAQAVQPLFNYNLIDSLKSWQLLVALFMPVVGWLWFDIFKHLNPEYKNWALFFLIWLLSLPVINKMAPMYNIETPSLILGSVIVWYLVKFVLKKPTPAKAFLLGILGGIIFSFRIMTGSLLLSLGLIMILLSWFKKVSFKKMLWLNLIFTVVALVTGAQYYFHYRDQGVFDSGENVSMYRGVPLWQRQPRNFYTDTFFKTMLQIPVRPNFPNRFIPIFYSTFWGDYWNYYQHRRYPLSSEEEIYFSQSPNREKISKERLVLLAWQNRINVIPTIVLIAGMLIAVKQLIVSLAKRGVESKAVLAENFLTLFFIVAFLTFFFTGIYFPNTYKGDNIKASYILYAITVLIYFGTKFLITISQRSKIIALTLAAMVSLSILSNLHFDWF